MLVTNEIRPPQSELRTTSNVLVRGGEIIVKITYIVYDGTDARD